MSIKNIPYIIHEAPMAVASSEIVSENNGKIIAQTILQDLGVQNRNRRIYLPNDLLPELRASRAMELLETGNLKGELGHPMSQELSRQQTIDPVLVCCKYLKLWNEGNLIKAHVTGTNNQYGDYFNRDLMDGEKPSFSLRALGTMQVNGGKSYVKNIKVITWDRVIYPSHKVAYVEKLITESADVDTTSINSNQVIVEESYQGSIIPITNCPQVKDFIKTESANLDIMAEAFGISSYDSVAVTKEGTIQMFNQDGSTLVMKPEDYILKEIRNYAEKNF